MKKSFLFLFIISLFMVSCDDEFEPLPDRNANLDEFEFRFNHITLGNARLSAVPSTIYFYYAQELATGIYSNYKSASASLNETLVLELDKTKPLYYLITSENLETANGVAFKKSGFYNGPIWSSKGDLALDKNSFLLDLKLATYELTVKKAANYTFPADAELMFVGAGEGGATATNVSTTLNPFSHAKGDNTFSMRIENGTFPTITKWYLPDPLSNPKFDFTVFNNKSETMWSQGDISINNLTVEINLTKDEPNPNPDPNPDPDPNPNPDPEPPTGSTQFDVVVEDSNVTKQTIVLGN